MQVKKTLREQMTYIWTQGDWRAVGIVWWPFCAVLCLIQCVDCLRGKHTEMWSVEHGGRVCLWCGKKSWPLLMALLLVGCVIEEGLEVRPGPAVVGTTNWAAVYVCDGVGEGGRGTLQDPFEAGTVEGLRFVWEGFCREKGKTLVFLPGTYLVDRSLMLRPGMRDVQLLGNGARLVFTNDAAVGLNHVIGSWWDGNANVTVEGFTIDCGSAARFVGDGKVAGIVLKGPRNVVRNCRVLNMVAANWTNNWNEAFGIILESTHGQASGNTVEGLVVPSGIGGGTGLVIMGDGNAAHGNSVWLGDPSYTNGYYSFGLAVYGNENTVSGNSVSGVDMALAMDQGGNGEFAGRVWRDNVFVGNRLRGSQIAFRIHPFTQGYADWTMVGNQFNTDLLWVDLYHHNGYKSNLITGFSFVGNRFGGRARTNGYNVGLSGFEWHRFEGNVWNGVVDRVTDGSGQVEWE